jgi:putative SOS response-associated peptidase YedK
MCGRFYVPEEHDVVFDAVLDQIRSRSGDQAALLNVKRGEVFPSDIVPALTSAGPLLMKWGFSLGTGRGLVINARLETAGEKPMFKRAFAKCRCLIPAGHYFEWKKESVSKEKYAIGQKKLLFMAGVFRDSDDAPVPQFVILTCPAVSRLAPIHDRMPAILPEDARALWLSGLMDSGELEKIASSDADSLETRPA